MPDHGALLSGKGPDYSHVSNGVHAGQLEYGSIINTSGGTSDGLNSEDDMEDMAVSEFTATLTNEDVASLMEPAISRAATRLKSAQTPALEKAAALEELDGGGYFESDDAETPPAIETPRTDSPLVSPTNVRHTIAGQADVGDGSTNTERNTGLSLGRLPSPKPEAEVGLPITPWRAGPKPFSIVSKDSPAQSALQGVFNNSRSRSLSGGADALKKFLPKGLPSIAQVGHSIFGTSSGNTKSRTWATNSPPKSPSNIRSGASTPSGSSPSFPQPKTFQSTALTRPPTTERRATPSGPQRPRALRRVTSDDGLLYHSLSRTSSLGDDTRFENHREQVNSRVKAIRDSLQDRSSFRMPQMPSLPSMPTMPRVPNFSFNMNFLTSTSPPARWRTDADGTTDILPGNIARKKSDPPVDTVVAPGIVSAAVARPEAAVEATKSDPSSYLDRAMKHLIGDVVIMGGYRGSILRSTRTNRQVWVPVKVGLNIRKVDLEVGLDPEDEDRMSETIYPSGMLQNIGPVDISKRLFKRLSECENARNGKLRIWDYGYDWRLSPALLSRKLTAFLESLPSNKQSADGAVHSNGGALVIAHSLGGLITRHVVNHRPDLFSGVIYAGVPQSCVNILGPLRNGDAVLLSSRVLTAQVNFTLRTSFVLLPEDGGCFIDINTKERYPVDFFNIDDWIKYRFSPCTDPPLPPRNQTSSGGLGSFLNKPASLLSLPIPRKSSTSISSDQENEGPQSPTKITHAADAIRGAAGGTDRTLAPQMGNNMVSNPVSRGQPINSSVSTAVTIPRDKAIAYLKRTLEETKKFKQELYFKPEFSKANRYPPMALIYGKSIPTCMGAKVDGREGIPCSDSYDNLAFASGDGVCLAKEAMLPVGYKVVHGGRISSDRGHITLLGDLNAVGRAIEAVTKGRGKGIGLGIVE